MMRQVDIPNGQSTLIEWKYGHKAIMLVFGKQRQEDCLKFRDSLIYTESSRPNRITQRASISKTTKSTVRLLWQLTKHGVRG